MYIRPDHLEKWSGHGQTGRIGRAAPGGSCVYNECKSLVFNDLSVVLAESAAICFCVCLHGVNRLASAQTIYATHIKH